MSVTFAAPAWPGPHAAPRDGGWLFGREVVFAGLPGAPRGVQWLQQRNCALTPLQLGGVFLSLAALSLLIGVFFYMQGAALVLAFSGLELLALGAAAAFCARHAGDRETLTLVGRSLRVEQCLGTQVARTEFTIDWLRIEPAAGQGSLLELSGQGQRVRVGRFLRPELRGAFARELRLALRRPAARAGTETDSN